MRVFIPVLAPRLKYPPNNEAAFLLIFPGVKERSFITEALGSGGWKLMLAHLLKLRTVIAMAGRSSSACRDRKKSENSCALK